MGVPVRHTAAAVRHSLGAQLTVDLSGSCEPGLIYKLTSVRCSSVAARLCGMAPWQSAAKLLCHEAAWGLCVIQVILQALSPSPCTPQDDRDRAAVLDRCAPACLRFVAGLEEAVSNPNPNPKPSAASFFMIKAAAGGPCTPRSVLPSRPSFSRPDSQPCPPCSPDTPRSGLPHHGPAAAAAAAAWAGGSLDSRNSFPGDAPKTSGGSGMRGPLEAAVSADAAWFRQRLAANCMV